MTTTIDAPDSPLVATLPSSLPVPSQPLSFDWSFGFNPNRLNTVHSLTTPSRSAIFYTSSHFAILHDLDRDTQRILTGHTHDIVAVAVSKDKRWIVTADSGGDNDSDGGSDSGALIIVWDSTTCEPARVLDSTGIAAVDITNDGTFIAAVTVSNYGRQSLHIYERSIIDPLSPSAPSVSAVIDSAIPMTHVRFHGDIMAELVLTSPSSVIFYHWRSEGLLPSKPQLGDAKLKGVGPFTQSCFVPKSSKAVTATQTGHVIVWDIPVTQSASSSLLSPVNTNTATNNRPIPHRSAVKLLKLIKSSITIITSLGDRYLVCGCSDGVVRFFDLQFRIVSWFENIGHGNGPIVSLSFDDLPMSMTNNVLSQTLASINNSNNSVSEQLLSPPFIAATNKGKIVALRCDSQQQSQTQGKLLLSSFESQLTCLSSHPTLPVFAVGSTGGVMSVWDLDERRLIGSRTFFVGQKSVEGGGGAATTKSHYGANILNGLTKRQEEEEKHQLNDTVKAVNRHASLYVDELVNHSCKMTCVEFSSDGSMLAVGFDNGFVRIINTAAIASSSVAPQSFLADVASFHRGQDAITRLSFSQCGHFLVTSDTGHYVSLYKFGVNEEKGKEKSLGKEWNYVGRYQCHSDTIVDMCFDRCTTPTSTTVSTDTEASPRLWSLGSDRRLNEFDVANSSVRSGLRLRTSTIIEELCKPTAMLRVSGATMNGSVGDDAKVVTDDSELLLIANDDYKLKIYELTNANKSASLVLRKTVLAPTFCGAITAMKLLPVFNPTRLDQSLSCSSHLLFSSPSSYVGLMTLPLYGHPDSSLSMLAHPGQPLTFTPSFDGQYLLSLGSGDHCVKVWRVETGAMARPDITDIFPYLELLDPTIDSTDRQAIEQSPLIQQLLDFFCLAQIQPNSSSTAGSKERVMTGTIPVHRLPSLCCAMGYYLTQQEAKELEDEIQFQNTITKKTINNEITLHDFIRIFINHRPVQSTQIAELSDYFGTLSTDPDDSERVSTEQLIKAIVGAGVGVSEEALIAALDSLLGVDGVMPAGDNDGESDYFASVMHRDDLSEAMKKILRRLPASMTAAQFAADLLGFDTGAAIAEGGAGVSDEPQVIVE